MEFGTVNTGERQGLCITQCVNHQGNLKEKGDE